MADFAAARAAHEADFADAERREVVVQHEALADVSPFQQFDALLVVLGAERAVTSACVSPRVNSAEPWVRGRTPTSIEIWRISIERAAVGTAALLQHLVAEDALLERVEALGRFGLLLFAAALPTTRFFSSAISA